VLSYVSIVCDVCLCSLYDLPNDGGISMSFEQFRIMAMRLDALRRLLCDDEPNIRRITHYCAMIDRQIKKDYPHHYEKLNSWRHFDE